MDVTDKNALRVLQMVMFVAKWIAPSNNATVVELSSSRDFGKLYCDLIEELIRGEPTHPRAVSSWKRWRIIEDRPDQLDRVRVWIRRTANWRNLSVDQRRELVLVLLSPFVATTATLDELLSMSMP
jgi:hypothetical protein